MRPTARKLRSRAVSEATREATMRGGPGSKGGEWPGKKGDMTLPAPGGRRRHPASSEDRRDVL